LAQAMNSTMRPHQHPQNFADIPDILLTAPLHFSDKSAITFAKWTDQRYFDMEKILAAFRNMPPEMIEYGAKALRPVENDIGNYVRLWDRLDNLQVVEAWHAMHTWVTDNIPWGATFRQLIVDLYQNNRLMKGTGSPENGST
jgi:polyhydroxyalkanoate synthase